MTTVRSSPLLRRRIINRWASPLVFLLVASLIPMTSLALLTATSLHQEQQVRTDADLTELARATEARLRNDLERFQEILLISAQNPAYTEIMRDPNRQAAWKLEVDRSLAQLTRMFPGMIDEACR